MDTGLSNIAGWLGAALCGRLESLGGLKRHAADRSLTVTPKGRSLLADYFGLGPGTFG